MPNKKAKSSKKVGFRISKKILILSIPITLLGIYWLGNTVVGFVDTREKQNRLEASAVVINEIFAKLKQNEDRFTIVREKKCYREETKLSDGWLVCEQGVKISGKAKNINELKMVISKLSTILDETPQFSGLPVPEMIDFDTNIELETYTVHPRSESLPPCVVHYVAFPNDHRLENERGKYEIELTCAESGLNKGIY